MPLPRTGTCAAAPATASITGRVNFWADPAAAQRVFSALSGKIYLTALNATDFVPITFDFSDRLGADNATVATATVVTILSDPDVREFMRQGLMYWWDPLNAAAAITGRLVTYERTRLTVVQSGVEAGRTVVDPRGARIRLGVAADAQAFENHFLAMLNRPTPQLPGQRPRHGSPKANRGESPAAPGESGSPHDVSYGHRA